MLVQWLSSWFAEQGVLGLNLGLATSISEIGYLLLPSRDMIEILLKWCKILKTTKPNLHVLWVHLFQKDLIKGIFVLQHVLFTFQVEMASKKLSCLLQSSNLISCRSWQVIFWCHVLHIVLKLEWQCYCKNASGVAVFLEVVHCSVDEFLQHLHELHSKVPCFLCFDDKDAMTVMTQKKWKIKNDKL